MYVHVGESVSYPVVFVRVFLFECKCVIMSVHAIKLQHDFDVNVSRLPLGMTEQDMQYIDLFNHNGCLDFAISKTKKTGHACSFLQVIISFYNRTSGTTIESECCCVF